MFPVLVLDVAVVIAFIVEDVARIIVSSQTIIS